MMIASTQFFMHGWISFAAVLVTIVSLFLVFKRSGNWIYIVLACCLIFLLCFNAMPEKRIYRTTQVAPERFTLVDRIVPNDEPIYVLKDANGQLIKMPISKFSTLAKQRVANLKIGTSTTLVAATKDMKSFYHPTRKYPEKLYTFISE